MKVKTLAVGPLETNCYIVWDSASGDAIVVDPGDEPDRILEESQGLTIKYIVLTHAHFDHSAAVPEVKEATGAPIVIHADETETYRSLSDQASLWGYEMEMLPEPEILLKEGDTVELGGVSLAVIHTPGHTPGGMSLYGEGTVITGDTLFQGSVGRTDFPGGSTDMLRQSFRRLMELPPDTKVLPGHGPATTVANERTGNIFSAGLG